MEFVKGVVTPTMIVYVRPRTLKLEVDLLDPEGWKSTYGDYCPHDS
jgi:hypothetical protein